MNFDLEEQLVRCSSDVDTGGEEQRKRAYTVMESSLEEKTQVGVALVGGAGE